MEGDRHIAVVGAGLMGHGIALTFARAGRRVLVTDPSIAALASLRSRIADGLRMLGAKASEVDETLERIEPGESVEAAVAGAAFVFEAAPEKLALKQAIFAEIEAHAPEDAMLASNTSVIQISKIMVHLSGRHRALGTHWWNPPHMIPLVEVVRTEWTGETEVATMMELLAEVGKTPVLVEKDVPGFIGNRLQHALWREAISLVENGVCSAEDVDTVVKSSFGRRLAVLGPLENADLVGTDLALDIHRNVLFDLDCQASPSSYLRRLVAAGRLGMSTGRGFRAWTDEEANAVRRRVGRHLEHLEEILQD